MGLITYKGSVSYNLPIISFGSSPAAGHFKGALETVSKSSKAPKMEVNGNNFILL